MARFLGHVSSGQPHIAGTAPPHGQDPAFVWIKAIPSPLFQINSQISGVFYA